MDYIKVETIYGVMSLCATNAKHIFLSTTIDRNSLPLTVNGVDVSGSAHMNLWKDGKWHIGNEFDSNGKKYPEWQSKQNGFYFRKAMNSSFNAMISDSQDKKLVDMLVTVTSYWAAQNAIILKKAEIKDLNEQIAKKYEEFNQLKDKAETAWQEAMTIEKRRNGLEQDLFDTTGETIAS